MGVLKLNLKFGAIFFLLLSASLFSTSYAGRRTPKLDKLAKGVDVGTADAAQEEVTEEEAAVIHERLLKVNTKDYGRYDPAPALVRPPFKLIPN